jgi:hypothetical protein
MFRLGRRSAAGAGVRFCDSCAEVSTAGERARRQHDRVRAQIAAVLGPR